MVTMTVPIFLWLFGIAVAITGAVMLFDKFTHRI